MKENFTIEDLKKAYMAGGNVTIWSDYGYVTKWRSFEDWYKEIYKEEEL